MKKLNYLLSVAVLFALLVTVGCSKDDGPGVSAEDQVKERLSKTWLISSATLASQTVTDLTGLTLTITDQLSYTSNGNTAARQPNPWPTSGTWVFKTAITDASTGSFVITRDDGLDINVTLTDTTLSLGLVFDDSIHNGSSREEAVDGSWVFEFTAQ